MSTEPTSALTLDDLRIAVAKKAGIAYYGADGTEKPQVPIDTHDLDIVDEAVHSGLRMFLNDSPRSGWRWARPVASVALWPDISETAGETVSGGAYDSGDDETLLTASSSVFFESMEEKTIAIDGVDSFVIKRYDSATTVYVYGDASGASSDLYSISSNGDYTLPKTFAGMHSGTPTFAPQTNRAVRLVWVDESTVRAYRENTTSQTGIPTVLAIAPFTPESGRRRYKLLTYPHPDENLTVEFPFDLSFDLLTDGADTLPSPLAHDETVRAACMAIVEREINEMPGPMWQYYREVCLPASHKHDARSAPRRLGYFGNNDEYGRVRREWRELVQRPDVNFTP